MSATEIDSSMNKLLDYVNREVDVRGLVEGKGWAHSIAHVADAITEGLKQSKLSKNLREELLLAIVEKMCFQNDSYLFEENERMVVPIITILQSEGNDYVLMKRIREKVAELCNVFPEDDEALLMYRFNFKQFLHSLYFHLEAKDQNEELRTLIKYSLRQLNEPYYHF
ncbi:Protein of unknown function [Oceanobacillus limi]|uniref:DUF2785 domain-containing protein n=1 Tax=Oceanobacillus limi TaxID=930131 RepID=A0A1I0B4H8_9BACI|nr:Protein of unknown function [Oceanobacillus limi]